MLYVIIYHIFKNRIKMEKRDTEESYSRVLQITLPIMLVIGQ
jgi:hypothetical protein